MTKIVLTKRIVGGAGGRIYIDKERILEVHENSTGTHCTIVLKSSSKDPELYEVMEKFDTVKAIMEFDPAVADIVIKGEEL